MAQIYLASRSPRRRELLTQLNIQYDLVDGDIDERQLTGESATDYVVRLASEKAQQGWRNSAQDKPVLGADTIVVYQQQLLGKPQSQQDAVQTLTLLSGNKHQVITAIAVCYQQSIETLWVESDVEFADISKDEILAYWQTGEPQDKAGSYAIQGIGGQFVKRIQGSYSAIVGLPLYETKQLVHKVIQQL
ncbi:maf protein [Catenovulum agarivorans DS-2]|uniref:dTTP/UTP pyrophosphatase n=1 Tax=Catenovulum agarivorans DS-2 TaxID=1328313 RepID=W7QID1_9ALTE|nr:Maf family protein [Catenovulum agarivorans]EWH11606.1 maf protein [Catenovulum agarivorans DS-2]